jgi:hypothetical protein
MDKKNKKIVSNLISRRGFPKYTENPSIGKAVSGTKTGVKRISNRTGDRFMIISEHGETIAPAGFHEIVEVDKTQFVKLYIKGVQAFQGLTAAGTQVFELVYRTVQESPGADRFYLHFMTIEHKGMNIGKRTFHRGLSELLKKEFIFESIEPNLYFLNVDYLFNGNRMAFIKEYRISELSEKKKLTQNQNHEKEEEFKTEIDKKTIDWIKELQ